MAEHFVETQPPKQEKPLLQICVILSSLSVVAYWASLVNPHWIEKGAHYTNRQTSGLEDYCRCLSYDSYARIHVEEGKIDYFDTDAERTKFNAIRVLAILTFVFAFLASILGLYNRSGQQTIVFSALSVCCGLVSSLMYSVMFGSEYLGGSFVIFVLGFCWSALGSLASFKSDSKLRSFGQLFHVLALGFLAVALSTSTWSRRNIRDTPFGGADPSKAQGIPGVIHGPQLFPADTEYHNEDNMVRFGRGLWEVCRCAQMEDNCRVSDGPILHEEDLCDQFNASTALAFLAGIFALFATYQMSLFSTSGYLGHIKTAIVLQFVGSILGMIATGLFAGLLANRFLSNAFGCFIFGWSFAFISALGLVQFYKNEPSQPTTAAPDNRFGNRTFLLALSAALFWVAQATHKWIENGRKDEPDSFQYGLYRKCTCELYNAFCEVNNHEKVFGSKDTCIEFNAARILIVVSWVLAFINAAAFYGISNVKSYIGVFSVMATAAGIAGAVLFADLYEDQTLGSSFAIFLISIFCNGIVAAGIFLKDNAALGWARRFASVFILLSMGFAIVAIGGNTWTAEFMKQSRVATHLPDHVSIDHLYTPFENYTAVEVQFSRSLWGFCQCDAFDMDCKGAANLARGEVDASGKKAKKVREKFFKNKKCQSNNATRALSIIAAVLITIAAFAAAMNYGFETKSFEGKISMLTVFAVVFGVIATIIYAAAVNDDKRHNTSVGYAEHIGGWALAAIAAFLSFRLSSTLAPAAAPPPPEVPMT